jgi:hypothetical protein
MTTCDHCDDCDPPPPRARIDKRRWQRRPTTLVVYQPEGAEHWHAVYDSTRHLPSDRRRERYFYTAGATRADAVRNAVRLARDNRRRLRGLP